MINSIEEYLSQLKKELAGYDRATIQDAISDAEEHLRNALHEALSGSPGKAEAEALQPIIEKYGMPEEVAAAYKGNESRPPKAAPAKTEERHSAIKSFFGVAADWRVWSAVFYLLLSLGTGIAYFTWVVTGLSLSAGLMVLIIGIPFAGLFILSVWGISLIEGRVVEALLGVRMPRRPAFSNKHLSLWGRFKALISDRYTYLSMLYMILQLPLGIIYFTVTIVLFSVSLFLTFQPVMELIFNRPYFLGVSQAYFPPGWLMPFMVVAGILMFFGTLHLAKWTGKLHGQWAKLMLVRG